MDLNKKLSRRSLLHLSGTAAGLTLVGCKARAGILPSAVAGTLPAREPHNQVALSPQADAGATPLPTPPSTLTVPTDFNVMKYGAVGNGTHDDTVAIQAAIDAAAASSVGGGTVYLPAGRYLTSSPLTIKSPNKGGTVSVSLVGAGAFATTIKTSGNFNAIQSAEYPLSSLSGAVFRDFQIEYPSNTSAGTAIYLPWADRVVLERLIIVNCCHGIEVGQDSARRLGTSSTINEVYLNQLNMRQVSGNALVFSGAGGNVFVTDSYFAGMGNATASKCLDWTNAASFYDVIWLRGLDFENFGSGLDFSTNGRSAGLTDSFLESIIVDGTFNVALNFSASNGASITRVKCRDLWLSTARTNACEHINSSSGGVIQDITHSGCNFEAGGGFGALVEGPNNGGATNDISYHFCQFYNSVNGFGTLGCHRLFFQNNTIGAPYGGGSGSGLWLVGGGMTTDIVVRNNLVTSAYPKAMTLSVGGGCVIRDNVGVDI